MPDNAPYSGGTSAGAKLFAVNGDFTAATPCGPPEISYPFKGDTFPGLRDIVLLNSAGAYVNVPLGSGYNVQPFRANQSAIIVEQEFMVAEAYYVPMRLNTLYNTDWSNGWRGDFALLDQSFLVEEGPLENVGGGIVKFWRKFATLPPTRNEFESYAPTFPSFEVLYGTPATQSIVRPAKTATVFSRVQYDYYVYDDLDLLSGLSLFPSGHRLNASTGLSPTGLILPEMRYYKPSTETTSGGTPNTVEYNMQLDGDQPLTAASIPSSTQYRGWIGVAEIVAEASSFGPGPWLGNIYQRKTRFVIAQ